MGNWMLDSSIQARFCGYLWHKLISFTVNNRFELFTHKTRRAATCDVYFFSESLTKQTTSPPESVTTHCLPVSAAPHRTGVAGNWAVHNDRPSIETPSALSW